MAGMEEKRVANLRKDGKERGFLRLRERLKRKKKLKKAYFTCRSRAYRFSRTLKGTGWICRDEGGKRSETSAAVLREGGNSPSAYCVGTVRKRKGGGSSSRRIPG